MFLNMLRAQYPDSFGLDSQSRLALLIQIDETLSLNHNQLGVASHIIATAAEELAGKLFEIY